MLDVSQLETDPTWAILLVTMSSIHNLDGDFVVQSDKCIYTPEAIVSDYVYVVSLVDMRHDGTNGHKAWLTPVV